MCVSWGSPLTIIPNYYASVSKCLSVIVYYTEDRRWMKIALSFSVERGLLDLLQYLVDTQGVTLTGELY